MTTELLNYAVKQAALNDELQALLNSGRGHITGDAQVILDKMINAQHVVGRAILGQTPPVDVPVTLEKWPESAVTSPVTSGYLAVFPSGSTTDIDSTASFTSATSVESEPKHEKHKKKRH